MNARSLLYAATLVSLALAAACSGNQSESGDTPTPGATAGSTGATPGAGGAASTATGATQTRPASSGTATGDGASLTTDLSWIYDAPYDPINLTVSLDEGRRAEAVMSTEGGSLFAEAADGTTFTLDVPPDALLIETVIAMTPVETLDGLPFGDGSAYAVELSPRGLDFNGFATLTIVPAEDIPVREQIMFGYEGDDRALTLALPRPNPDAIEILLGHFSGAGVSKGLLADLEPVRRRMGGNVEARLQGEVAAALQAARQQALLGDESANIGDILGPYMDEYYEKVVSPRLNAAGVSCANARVALETLFKYQRQVQLLGLVDRSAGTDVSDLVTTAGKVCLKEEYELCKEQHIIHRMVPVWLTVLRQAELLGANASEIDQLGRDYVDRCLRFELEFESNAEIDDGQFTSVSHVSAKFPLRVTLDLTDLHLSGFGPHDYRSYLVTNEDCPTTPESFSGSTFEAVRLTYSVSSYSLDAQVGEVRDFTLTYIPGQTSESLTVSCPDQDPATIPGPAWTHAYLGAHEAEGAQASGAFTAEGWEILAGELYAQKEWDLSNTVEVATFKDNGSFKLHHKPE